MRLSSCCGAEATTPLMEDLGICAECRDHCEYEEEQTPVEWLFLWMQKHQYFIGNDLLEAYKTARKMEESKM